MYAEFRMVHYLLYIWLVGENEMSPLGDIFDILINKWIKFASEIIT